jgi:YrbI family 3-deoxy-D-manno-octulosonate 8-phosphate phosphatase
VFRVTILTSSTEQLANIRAIAFDFDGVFTDNRVYVMQNGDEAVACDRSDGMGISMLRVAGVPMVIISTERNPVVAARGAKLKLEVLQGIDDKLPTLVEWASKNGLTIDQIAFVGNDINDVECLRGAGLGVVVGDAYPVAVESADIQLTRNGGRGAVREIADLWMLQNSAAGR